MRKTLVAVFMLCSTVAFAQTAAPAPEADDKPPPAQVKKGAAKPKEATQSKETTQPHSIAAKLQACLEIDDGTKGRLDCYDAVIKPAPKPKPPAAKGVMDCRFLKEEDERLNCFNGFAESIPKFR
jgi:hypothetical protein